MGYFLWHIAWEYTNKHPYGGTCVDQQQVTRSYEPHVAHYFGAPHSLEEPPFSASKCRSPFDHLQEAAKTCLQKW